MKKNTLLSFFLMPFLLYPSYASSLVPVEADGKYGYQNDAGELIIPAIYLTAEPFTEDGLALVSQDVAGDGWPFDHGFIDETGATVVALRYQYLNQFSEGFAAAQRNGKYGYITPTGAVAVDFIYSEASDFNDGKAVVKLDGEFIVIERPNWEESTLNIRETDYIAFQSTNEFLEYFSQALENFDGSLAKDSDYVVLEKFFVALLSKMTPLEAQVDGESVLILSQNYADILTASKDIYASLTGDLNAANIEVNESLEGYLRLIYNGVANVQYNGTTVTIDSNINYQVVPFPVPYFDKTVYSKFTQNGQFHDYLSSCLAAMGGASPNLSGAEGLVSYINHIFINLEPLHLSSSFNKITVGTKKQVEFFQEIYEINTEINNTLAQYNIQLHENVSNSLLVLVDNTNMEKKIKLEFNSEYLLPYLSGMDGIRIVFGNEGQGVYLPADDLSYILSGRDTFVFELYYEGNSCDLVLYEADGKTITTEIPASIFLIMPAATKTTTVFAFLDSQADQNWGGVVKLNNTIEFATTYSGNFVTREARSEILDIDHLSFETQEKIHFMVSKGFFSLEGGMFYPEETMLRSEFISALVKLFFAQDSNATSNFSDLSEDDPNYAFISAAYQAGIVEGYADDTFRGSNPITRYEIVSFLSSTLAANKGFTLTLDPLESIQVFSDYASISEWAVESVALAVEHNLIDTYGTFSGDEEVSRKEVAQLLNTLFYELYDSEDAVTGNLSLYSVKEGISYPIIPLILAILAIIAVFVGTHLHRKSETRKRVMERMKIVTEALTKDLEEGNDFDEYI